MREDNIGFWGRVWRWWCNVRQCPAMCNYAPKGEPIWAEFACQRNRFHFGAHRDVSGEWNPKVNDK